jgi:hypothetical protein
MFVMVSSLNLNKHLPEMVRNRQLEDSPGHKKVNCKFWPAFTCRNGGAPAYDEASWWDL